jgi:hypothetical protein
MSVFRTDTGQICANGKWFDLRALVDTAFERVRAWGSDNPGFDAPNWFYTGSPYADEIVALGCAGVDAPKEYRIESVPPLGKVWRSRDPLWPVIFNCAVKDDF